MIKIAGIVNGEEEAIELEDIEKTHIIARRFRYLYSRVVRGIDEDLIEGACEQAEAPEKDNEQNKDKLKEIYGFLDNIKNPKREKIA